MTLGEVAAAIGAELWPQMADIEVVAVSTDSRRLIPGSLFFALKGERFDGHDYVQHAAARGARAAVVQRDVAANLPLLRVPDTLAALGHLARAYRRSLPAKVAAITGSVGKTTTHLMAASIFARHFNALIPPENYNNEIGVPLAILAAEQSTAALVLELAMRGKGQIAYLAQICQPHIGAITRIGVTHIGLLGSLDDIAQAKAELLSALPADGRAVLNADDRYFSFLAQRAPCPVLSFGLDNPADVFAENLLLRGAEGSQFTLRIGENSVAVDLRAPGRHNVANALCAAAVAHAAGVPLAEIAAGLAHFRPAALRSEILHTASGTTILCDAYNASPESVAAALDLLASLDCSGLRYAVLGDMLELGEHAPQLHRAVGQLVAHSSVNRLICLGQASENIARAACDAGMAADSVWHCSSHDDVVRLLRQLLRPGDLVLVKGSRAMRMETIIRQIAGESYG